MTISERSLRKWRREALSDIRNRAGLWAFPNEHYICQLSKNILKLTQELLDNHLIRKKGGEKVE